MTAAPAFSAALRAVIRSSTIPNLDCARCADVSMMATTTSWHQSKNDLTPPKSLGPCLQRIYRIDCNKRPRIQGELELIPGCKVGGKENTVARKSRAVLLTCLISPAETHSNPIPLPSSLWRIWRIIGLHRIKNTVDRAQPGGVQQHHRSPCRDRQMPE